MRNALERSDFETLIGGERAAVTFPIHLTGRGADINLIDDPLKPEEGLSEAQRQACNEWCLVEQPTWICLSIYRGTAGTLGFVYRQSPRLGPTTC